MLRPDSPTIEIVRSDADNTVGWVSNIYVQIRTGRMTLEALRELQSTARLIRARTPGKVGAFAVLEESAEVLGNEVRTEQKQVVGDLLADPRSYACAYIAGGGTKATLLRSIPRLITPSSPRVHTARSIEEGAAWLAGALGTHTAAEIVRIVESVREVARKSVRGSRG